MTAGDLTTYIGQDVNELTAKNGIFWIAAKNGYYLHRPSILGNAIIPNTPATLTDFPHKTGYLDYTFPRLPDWIINQAIHFFTRTYDRLGTEAEVLISYNPNAEPNLRLFVPPQRVTSASVHSAFDPSHLGRGWQLLGSIHSHCNFSAFHSGTDHADASDFEGIHITIGNLKAPRPSFAAMVTAGGVRWDFEIEELADVSNLTIGGIHSAPQWWDRYILNDHNNAKIATTYNEHRPAPRYTPPPSYLGSKWSYPDSGGYDGWGTDDWDDYFRWAKAKSDYKGGSTPAKPANEALDYIDRLLPPTTKPSVHPEDRPGSEAYMQLIDQFIMLTDKLAEHNIYPADLLTDNQIFSPEDWEDRQEAQELTTQREWFYTR
jgi:hypothetical protein